MVWMSMEDRGAKRTCQYNIVLILQITKAILTDIFLIRSKIFPVAVHIRQSIHMVMLEHLI